LYAANNGNPLDDSSSNRDGSSSADGSS